MNKQFTGSKIYRNQNDNKENLAKNHSNDFSTYLDIYHKFIW